MQCKPVKCTSVVIILCCFVFFATTGAEPGMVIRDKKTAEHYGNETFSDKVHTVMLRSSTWELSTPVIELGTEQRLELIFDDLTAIPRSFSYSLVHCDADWNRSDLQPQEYLTGTGQGNLHESASSINTTYGYIHYRLEFPEEDCMPVLSGNYALVVFDADDPDKVLLTRRLYVVEKIAHVEGKVKQAQPGEFMETSQQVSFTLTFGSAPIRDPLNDLSIFVRQNGRDDRMLNNMRPSAIAPDKIEYAGPDEGIFPGGNEFRTLDIKSMKYQTENIAAIDFQNPYYHVYLKPDKSRENKPYFSKADLNGHYFINQEKSREKHLEADYVFVHFSLDQSFPIPEDIYVIGDLTGWSLTSTNKMVYNNEKKCYESTLLLKQGLYDYAFTALDKSTSLADEALFEGSYYETGNDYEIFVYLHDSRSRYDRLICYLPLKINE
jgi:hypothetical protein